VFSYVGDAADEGKGLKLQFEKDNEELKSGEQSEDNLLERLEEAALENVRT